MSDKVRIAVVGVGHLGTVHARLLAKNPNADLVAVADINLEQARRVAEEYNTEACQDYERLEGKVDAVCVVVPTQLHLPVASFFLERGVDVLVEKPIAPSVTEGERICELAKANDRILQVGHIERFNPALDAIKDLGLLPRYIESTRMAPFSFRSTDIGVVLDLMIHDIDLVHLLVGSKVVEVDAFGGKVFTSAEDMASAILKFENGAVAHLTANRVALRPMRRMRLFAPDCYASLDFQKANATLIRKNSGWDQSRLDLETLDLTNVQDLWKFVFQGLLTVKEVDMDAGNPLMQELEAFLSSVRDRTPPVVGGEAACAAVAVAEMVIRAVAKNPWS